MNKNELYLVVPRIVEQSTWGGDYILDSKKWQAKNEFAGKKIGQSYELFSGSLLRADLRSSEDASFTGELAGADNYDEGDYVGDKSKLIKIDDLLKFDSEWLLGPDVVAKHGANIKTLIKYTQAKGNSFQMHVCPTDEGKWLAKPESWYYLEPGILTLGVKTDTDWADYENACRMIDLELKVISDRVKSGEIDISVAKEMADKLVKEYNPWQFVNVITAEKDDLIDLSCCGLHHSWEDGGEKFPLGNVVYEFCLDVMDSVSSIRSFDKGKLKSDGSLRPVHIDDYFQYIDRTAEINNPNSHCIKKGQVIQGDGYELEKMLRTDYYSMDRFTIDNQYSGEYTMTGGSFHHLFVRSGKIKITSANSELEIGTAHSCFIPAGTGQYSIEAIGGKCEILKTFIGN